MPYSARADKSTTIFAKLAKQRFAVTLILRAPGIASIQGGIQGCIDEAPLSKSTIWSLWLAGGTGPDSGALRLSVGEKRHPYRRLQNNKGVF